VFRKRFRSVLGSILADSGSFQVSQRSHKGRGKNGAPQVTGDGRIRQELLPNGRYDEARGARKSAYTGRYEVTGTYIEYWDDTGFTADGTFVDADTLHHGGIIFFREK